MMLIHRILCPTDFSDQAEHAFRYADRLAECTGAELLLLHVYDLPESFNFVGDTHPGEDEVRKQMDAMQSAFEKVKLTRLEHAGPPAEVICWKAQEQKCDLIVMGTHGRGGLLHVLLGSVAEQVMRNARCPVLTIRKRPADEPPLPEPQVHYPVAPRL